MRINSSNIFQIDSIFCCLQEAKIQVAIYQDIRKNRLICLDAENQHCGLGFIVSDRWKENIQQYWKVSERIAVIQLKLREKEYVCEESDAGKKNITF